MSRDDFPLQRGDFLVLLVSFLEKYFLYRWWLSLSHSFETCDCQIGESRITNIHMFESSTYRFIDDSEKMMQHAAVVMLLVQTLTE